MIRLLLTVSAALFILGKTSAGEASCEGVVYNNKCYHLAYTYGTGVSLNQGKSWCRFFRGKLAEINSERTYDVIYDYVLNNWVDKKRLFVNVLTGSTYDPASNLIGLSSGDKWRPRSSLWHPGWPINQNDKTSIGFQVTVGPRTTSLNRGFYNENFSTISHSAQHSPVPLCERDI